MSALLPLTAKYFFFLELPSQLEKDQFNQINQGVGPHVVLHLDLFG
jgi:hypothetical protein